MSRILQGYFPIMATPYREDGGVDLPGVRRLVDFLVENGAQGMSPNGGDSEARHLTAVERMQIVDAVMDANGGRTPVFVGTTAHTEAESVQLTVHARKAGADAVFAKPSWTCLDMGHEEMTAYYEALCEAADIPIMVHGSHNMDAAFLAGLIDRFPNIRYVKEETTPNGARLREYVRELGDRVTIFGPGLHYPGELGWGAMGVMPSCCAPRAHARIFDLWQEGRRDEARREWDRMLPLVFWRWHTAPGEAGKLFLMHVGVFETAYVRELVTLPGQSTDARVEFGTLRLDEHDRQEMLGILDEMGGPPY